MCRVGVSRKLWKTILFLWTRGQRGVVAIAVIYLDAAILRESVKMRMSKREAERRVGLYAEALSSFFSSFFLSTLRNKWSRASETERENKERESCFEMLSILTVLLVHLGHLLFRCHLSCQWQMTQHQSGGSGRQPPGTHSPQAKLVQDLVHLLAPPLPHPSSHPIYTVSNISHILHLALGLLISLLTLQRHISPSLSN